MLKWQVLNEVYLDTLFTIQLATLRLQAQSARYLLTVILANNYFFFSHQIIP